MKYMEALRDAKRLTAVSGIKHDVFQREYVDSEGYTVTENYVSEVRPNAARAAG